MLGLPADAKTPQVVRETGAFIPVERKIRNFNSVFFFLRGKFISSLVKTHSVCLLQCNRCELVRAAKGHWSDKHGHRFMLFYVLFISQFFL